MLTDDRRYPDPAQLVTLLDNHDLPRLASECPEQKRAVNKLYAIIESANGISRDEQGIRSTSSVSLDGRAVHMIEAPAGTAADWVSYWASLTFDNHA